MTQKSTPEAGQANTFAPSGGGSASASQGGLSHVKEGMPSVARELSAEVTHMASDLADGAKKAAETKLGAGKDFAAEHLGSVADALRKTSKELRSNDSAVTDYVDKAASSVERVSEYFQTRTLSQLMGDVESYARREPAVFLGGAFFVGMLGGRFLKAATPAPTNTDGAHPLETSSSGGRALPPRGGSSASGGGGQKNDATARRDGEGRRSHEQSSHQGQSSQGRSQGQDQASSKSSSGVAGGGASASAKDASSMPYGATKTNGERDAAKSSDASRTDKGPGAS